VKETADDLRSITVMGVRWLERDHGLVPLTLPPKEYYDPRVSPDGEHIAVEAQDGCLGAATRRFVETVPDPQHAVRRTRRAALAGWEVDRVRIR
jgi:hypothetical protein